MAEPRPFFPPASRALLGVAIVIAASGLTFGQSRAVERPIEELIRLTENRTPGDSVIYANAAYHAAHASASYRDRWKPTGYLTLGTTGVALGAALVLSALWKRTAGRDKPSV